MSYHDSLKKKHSEDRANTIKVVKEAIQIIKDIEGENAAITAKKILMYSSVSRSVLYKQHILKVWNTDLWQKRNATKEKINAKYKEEDQKMLQEAKREIETLNFQLEKAKREIHNLKGKLEFQKDRSKVYKADLELEKFYNQKLLGECQRLADKLKARGFEA